jgi:hypothetical protein
MIVPVMSIQNLPPEAFHSGLNEINQSPTDFSYFNKFPLESPYSRIHRDPLNIVSGPENRPNRVTVFFIDAIGDLLEKLPIKPLF